MSTIASPGQTTQTSTGGLFTAGSNIGSHSRNEFTAITELGLNLGYRFSPCTQLNVGYTLIYINDVISPAKNIDTSVGGSSGHPLVEGILAHYEESALGRVARIEVEIAEQRGQGLLAVYKDGPEFEIIAFDSAGVSRPDWATVFRERPLRVGRVTDALLKDYDWASMVRRLGRRLDPTRRPHAIAAIAVRPHR